MPVKQTILVVDDNYGHAKLIMKNLRRSGLKNKMVHADNGKKALDYILGQGKFKGEEHVDDVIMLLDLNMPVMDGFQVLEYVRRNSKIKHIPIIVLSTTDDKNEIKKCYNMGCNMFITKPIDYEEFEETIRKLGSIFSFGKVPPVKGI